MDRPRGIVAQPLTNLPEQVGPLAVDIRVDEEKVVVLMVLQRGPPADIEHRLLLKQVCVRGTTGHGHMGHACQHIGWVARRASVRDLNQVHISQQVLPTLAPQAFGVRLHTQRTVTEDRDNHGGVGLVAGFPDDVVLGKAVGEDVHVELVVVRAGRGQIAEVPGLHMFRMEEPRRVSFNGQEVAQQAGEGRVPVWFS